MIALKARLYSLIILTLAGFLVACGGSGSDNATEAIIIKFPHVTAPGTPKGMAADRFKRLAEERLAGRVQVEVYPSGQLMNDDDAIDGLAFGEVQMLATALSKYDRITKKYQVFDLPFLFRNLEDVEQFQTSRQGKALLKSMVDKGYLGLAYWHNGLKQFGGPRPMNAPENAAGLKFRVMESDVLEAQILQINGNPQKMALPEVYQALQTGAVDAQENTWSNLYSSKFYEVQDYLTVTNHGYVGYMLTVNPDFWAGLPDDIRSELEVVVAEVTDWVNTKSEEINAEAKEKISNSGVSKIVELTDTELVKWQETMRPVWQQFEQDIGVEIIDAAMAISSP